MSPNTEDLQSSGAASEPMSEAPRLQNSGNEPLPPAQNNELNEITWQKWIDRNKERDAAHRKKLIRILWLVSLLRRSCCCLAAYSEQVMSKPTRGTVKKWAQPSARRKDACSKHITMQPKPTPMRLRNFGVRWAQWTSRNMTRYFV